MEKYEENNSRAIDHNPYKKRHLEIDVLQKWDNCRSEKFI